MTEPASTSADERYVITVNQLARILNSVDAEPFHAWGNLTEPERADYEALAVSELADHGVRPLAPAARPQRAPERPAGAEMDPTATETPNGPQTGADGFQAPDGLRDQIADALRGVEVGRWNIREQTDAVLAVVEPQRVREAEATRLLVHQRQELAARVARAEAAVQRVRRIHAQQGDYCAVCTTDHGQRRAPWPCPTIAAIDTREQP